MVNEERFINNLSCNDVREELLSKITCSKDEQSQKGESPSPNDETEEGIVIWVNKVHSEKALASINVTEEGILICFNEVHPEKALLAIFVTELGIITYFNEEQSSNADSGIVVTEEGIFILASDLQPIKDLGWIEFIVESNII